MSDPYQKIAEAYQVIGYLLEKCDMFDTDEGQRALDYFTDCEGPARDDFLPWPRQAERELRSEEWGLASLNLSFKEGLIMARCDEFPGMLVVAKNWNELAEDVGATIKALRKSALEAAEQAEREELG